MPSTKQTQQNILKIIYFQQTNNSQLIKQKRENEIQRTYQNKRGDEEGGGERQERWRRCDEWHDQKRENGRIVLGRT